MFVLCCRLLHLAEVNEKLVDVSGSNAATEVLDCEIKFNIEYFHVAVEAWLFNCVL